MCLTWGQMASADLKFNMHARTHTCNSSIMTYGILVFKYVGNCFPMWEFITLNLFSWLYFSNSAKMCMDSWMVHCWVKYPLKLSLQMERFKLWDNNKYYSVKERAKIGKYTCHNWGLAAGPFPSLSRFLGHWIHSSLGIPPQETAWRNWCHWEHWLKSIQKYGLIIIQYNSNKLNQVNFHLHHSSPTK